MPLNTPSLQNAPSQYPRRRVLGLIGLDREITPFSGGLPAATGTYEGALDRALSLFFRLLAETQGFEPWMQLFGRMLP